MKTCANGLLWILLCTMVVISRSQDNISLGNETYKAPLKTITLGVIIPTTKPYIFRREMVEPAIAYAVKSVEGEVASLGYKLQVAYRDSNCSRRASIAAVDLYYDDDEMYYRSFNPRRKNDKRTSKRKKRSDNSRLTKRESPLVFIGPACNEAASMVATFADAWNIPIITSGAPAAWIAPGPNYPTLTRVGFSYFNLAYFITDVFSTLGYGFRIPVHLLYEQTLDGAATERDCYFIMQAVHHVMNRNPSVQLFGPTYIIGDFDENRIATDMGDPRVVLMCANSDIVRKIMIGAYRTGHANPEVNHWYAIDLHNTTHYARGAWRRGDEYDDIAKEAFKSLLLITCFARNNLKFNNFMYEMDKKYMERGIVEKVNEFVVGFHDAVILYKDAMKRTIKEGNDIRDGRAVTKNMKNVTIDGIAGPIVMNVFGDRLGDYSILAMTDPKAGTFTTVYDYLGTFDTGYNRGLPWLDFSKPGNEINYTFHQSGADVEAILAEANRAKARILAQSTSPHEILAGILGTFGGMILCCALIFGPMCYQRRRHRSRASMSENGFGQFFNGNSDQMCHHRPLREEASVATCATTIEDEQKL